jgi:hypothetical protein
MTRFDGSIHIRIGRLSLETAALRGLRHEEFGSQLREAIAGRVCGDAALPPHPIADPIADAISARLASQMASPRSSGGSGTS